MCETNVHLLSCFYSVDFCLCFYLFSVSVMQVSTLLHQVQLLEATRLYVKYCPAAKETVDMVCRYLGCLWRCYLYDLSFDLYHSDEMYQRFYPSAKYSEYIMILLNHAFLPRTIRVAVINFCSDLFFLIIFQFPWVLKFRTIVSVMTNSG